MAHFSVSISGSTWPVAESPIAEGFLNSINPRTEEATGTCKDVLLPLPFVISRRREMETLSGHQPQHFLGWSNNFFWRSHQTRKSSSFSRRWRSLRCPRKLAGRIFRHHSAFQTRAWNSSQSLLHVPDPPLALNHGSHAARGLAIMQPCRPCPCTPPRTRVE